MYFFKLSFFCVFFSIESQVCHAPSSVSSGLWLIESWRCSQEIAEMFIAINVCNRFKGGQQKGGRGKGENKQTFA